MAWITVDQKLIGGKLRDFARRSGISQNEAIGILVSLWLWGIDNADQSGQIVAANVEDIENAIRPGFRKEDIGRIPEIVQNLVECGWIDQTDDSLFLHDWMDWRTFYVDNEEKRAKQTEYMRKYRARKAQEAEESQDQTEESKSETAKEPEKKKRNDYSVAFETFWDAYPRRVDKGNAYKKYQARLKDGYSDEDLITAARNYRKQCDQEKTEARYIKHPKTFLSDTMPFVDYLDKTSQTQQTQTDNSGYTSYNGNPFLDH